MSQRRSSGRVQCMRNHHNNLSLAIANLANALEEFCEQESAEVRSYPFRPSPAEREAVGQLIARGKADQNWRSLIDVDRLEKGSTRWIHVRTSSSAEFVGRFSSPDPAGPQFQGGFEQLEVRESCG